MTDPTKDRPRDSLVADADAESLFRAVVERLEREGARTPSATYRVQLRPGFTFDDATALVDYLRALGVSDVYASPFFAAREGSPHGYDLVDHNAINAELGGAEGLARLSDALRRADMGLLLDVVPNHMGIGTERNTFWMDVLENGPSSLYAPFFDVDWNPLKSELRDKVLLPVLGAHYGRVLENGELHIEYDKGSFFLRYHATRLPLNPRSYPAVLALVLPQLAIALGEEHDAVLELQSIITNLLHLPHRTETERHKVVERNREKEILKRRLAALAESTPEMPRALASAVETLNGRAGSPRSFDALDALLEEQAYRLSYWRVAAEEINYRRFFDINDLAAIRMEHPPVFQHAHRLLFELVREGRVTGLRVDHPDGLWDPAGYFAQLQRGAFLERCRREYAAQPEAEMEHFEAMKPGLSLRYDRAATDPRARLSRSLYVVVEKILSRGETLPGSWPVHGTSGYDFANAVGGLFVDGVAERAMTESYARFTGLRVGFDALAYQKKKLILLSSLASELNVLAHALNRLSEGDRHSRDFTLGVLTNALREVIACFPVYRTYVTERAAAIDPPDRAAVDRAVRLARRRDPTTDASVYAFLRSTLLLEPPETVPPEDRAAWRNFVMKFQQLTGPVMAKGLEDTAFYIYNRLLSLNEVGGEPERFGSTVRAFHRANEERQDRAPAALLATSTHDTKRSEDVRARISVLTEMPEAWDQALSQWAELNAPLETDYEGAPAPDRNEQYLLYQTLLGTFPFEPPEGKGLAEYTERMVAYLRKATKEAKVNTSWINADPDYDAAVERFVRGVLAPDGAFVPAFFPLARTVAFFGAWNSLAQTVLKFAAPGVPDTYQGNECWDFSLVDPDNRRSVDFGARRSLLAALRERSPGNGGDGVALARELVARARDGRIKLWVTHAALAVRRAHPALFGEQSAYAPLEADGPRAEHVVAFTRHHGDDELVAVVPRLCARLTQGALEPPVGRVWADTRLPVADGRFTNAFTGEVVTATGERGVALEQVLANFPVALLVRERAKGGGREGR